MRKFQELTILIAVLALFGAGAAQAGKQAICHFPPGNEANFHTIVVSDDAVANHVALHGDLVGSCLENCEAACDDGIFCTQDVQANLDECICVPEPRPESNCDDSNPCTVDTCNADVEACTYDTEIQNGTACDDGFPDTVDDVCNGGRCRGRCPCWTAAELELIADGQTQACGGVFGFDVYGVVGTDAATGGEEFARFFDNESVCQYQEQSPPTLREVSLGLVGGVICRQDIIDECEARGCLDVICEPLDQCHIAGACTGDGECTNPNAPDGTTCNDGDAGTTDDVCTGGVCAGTAASSCSASGGTCRTGTACPPGEDIEIEGGPWADCPPDEQLCCTAGPQ